MASLRVPGWRVELADRIADVPLPVIEREVIRLVDPGNAIETLHWGRNYLYRTILELDSETVPVVVKQFRNHSRAARVKRAWRGSKAMLSFRMADRLTKLGLGTPEPLMVIDSEESSGPSFYVCRHLDDALEARYPLRAMNAGNVQEVFPELDADRLLLDMGRLARRLHEGGIWHRDLTSGNVLLCPAPGTEGGVAAGREPDYRLYLVDLNRARVVRRLSLNRRAAELGRMPIDRPDHQELYLRGYREPQPVGAALRSLYLFHHQAFLLRNRSKKNVRGLMRRAKDLLLPRLRPHVHIPAADPRAGARDKIVWDSLSDQPHQHASRLEKARVRVVDAPSHLVSLWVGAVALGRARRRARELAQEPRRDIALDGLGVCLRPRPEDPESLLAAVDDLGVKRVLLRLHPWSEHHVAEEELAKALVERGLELGFALPQSRELVREPERWQASIERLGSVFAPLGRTFQIGQAINRSKWGVWNHGEYVDLFLRAAEALRSARSDVELLGPSVIDFEPHVTAALLNLDREGLRFDALSSLLYVDRRGAPEGRQLGLDTVGKVTLLKALAETSRNCPSGRSWITEFNWPLREGPHSPAGKDVAVDEESQADYLVRYVLLALASGCAERVYWWQVIAKGYGLIDPVDGGTLRRRPSFEALKVLLDQTRGARARTPVAEQPGVRFVELERSSAPDLWIGWTVGTGPRSIELPRPASGRIARDGRREEWSHVRSRVELSSSPSYFELVSG